MTTSTTIPMALEHTQHPLTPSRDPYARLYQGVLWPAWERIVRRRDTPDHFAFLQESQWLSPERIAAHQLGELKTLLTCAGEHVPYYRELFERVGFDPRAVTSRRDLEALPLLTREIIHERYDDLLVPENRGKNIVKSTSGSTGVPVRIEYNQDSDCWRNATRIRGYMWSGYRPGEPTLFYWGAGAPTTGARRAKIELDRALRRETYLDCLGQDEASMREAVQTIRRIKPHAIVGYVQAAARLARWILDQGLRDWDDVPVVCGAEAVLPADRAVLQRAFGPVFETYGSRETMLLAAECEEHDGMHLSEENILVEVVTKGRAVAAGEVGDVVVTDLHNFGLPLIRYANGDTAVMSADTPCACGRGLRKMARVEGRRADTLVDRDGNAVPGMAFHVAFSDADRDVVRQFQAVQRANGEVVLKIVRGREFSPKAFEAKVARFRPYLRGLPLVIEYVDEILAGPSGKMRTIIVERG